LETRHLRGVRISSRLNLEHSTAVWKDRVCLRKQQLYWVWWVTLYKWQMLSTHTTTKVTVQ